MDGGPGRTASNGTGAWGVPGSSLAGFALAEVAGCVGGATVEKVTVSSEPSALGRAGVACAGGAGRTLGRGASPVARDNRGDVCKGGNSWADSVFEILARGRGFDRDRAGRSRGAGDASGKARPDSSRVSPRHSAFGVVLVDRSLGSDKDCAGRKMLGAVSLLRLRSSCPRARTISMVHAVPINSVRRRNFLSCRRRGEYSKYLMPGQCGAHDFSRWSPLPYLSL